MIDNWYIVLVIQSLSRLWLRSPMVCSTPGSSVLLCLPEFAQMPVHSQLCYLIIPPSVALFLFCPQSFPASGSFPVSQFFASGSPRALMYSFPNLESVYCSMSSSNCCFLTCIQASQEGGKVVWYSHLFKNFPQFAVIHTVSILVTLQLVIVFNAFTFGIVLDL